jgi:hypothetical protein
MFYRPKYCCNCGEKIERPEWRIWTSRRFCDLCATDYTLREYGKRILAGTAVFIGVFGFGSFLQSRPAGGVGGARSELLAKADAQPRTAPLKQQATNAVAVQSQPTVPVAPAVRDARTAASVNTAGAQAKTLTEPVYYCGAATKKGTPCSRRVKTANTRCWQHVGLPAMNTGAKSLSAR